MYDKIFKNKQGGERISHRRLSWATINKTKSENK